MATTHTVCVHTTHRKCVSIDGKHPDFVPFPLLLQGAHNPQVPLHSGGWICGKSEQADGASALFLLFFHPFDLSLATTYSTTDGPSEDKQQRKREILCGFQSETWPIQSYTLSCDVYSIKNKIGLESCDIFKCQRAMAHYFDDSAAWRYLFLRFMPEPPSHKKFFATREQW